MKKIFSVLLCLCLFFSFSACGKENKKNENFVDIEYYAKLGQLPEAKYCLGDDVDTAVSELSGISEKESETHDDADHSHNHDEQEFYFEYVEGENDVLLDNGTVSYYYKKAKRAEGISYVVNYDTAFGFEIGTVILEIKEALSDFELKEEPLNEENAFFATYVSDGTVLRAEFEKATILFVFQENELFATAMYNENWSN